MATRTKYVDWGGLTPIVNGIRVGATKPGQLGTELTGTEIALLDGITAGTVTASKAVVVDSSSNITGFGTISATGAIAGGRVTVADTAFASPTLLTVAQSGGLCVFDNTAGAIFTLPAAAAGLWYDFVVLVASSSNSHRVACTTGDFLVGSVLIHATDDTGLSSAHAANGTTHLAIQLDADTVGRLAGSTFRCTAISATQWVIEGNLLGTGTIATPFETS